jgi:dTDP-4-dehydrorhamnose reductase
MKIILFGSTGMLGNYVNKYLLSKYEIRCINRNHFDIESCDWSKMYTLLDSIVENKDIIINCAGTQARSSD